MRMPESESLLFAEVTLRNISEPQGDGGDAVSEVIWTVSPNAGYTDEQNLSHFKRETA